MKHFKDLCVAVKLYMLTFCFITGFVVLGIVFINTMNKVRIRGAMYNDIVKSKDLIADILPPPEYIIESNLLIFQALSETDNTKVKEIVDHFNKLKGDFLVRHEYWMQELEDGQMKELIATMSYRPAQQFYEIAEKEFFPALLSGERMKAEEVATRRLKVLYEEHRSQIDQLVKIAKENNEKIEGQATGIIKGHYIYLVFIGIAIVILICIFCFVIIRQLLGQLGGEPSEVVAITREIANGNLLVPFDQKRKKRGIYSAVFEMNEKLKSIVASVVDEADNITGIGQQLRIAMQQISLGANEQASSVEEISSSIELMLQNIQQNNQNAKIAERIAAQAVDKMRQSDIAIKNSTKSIRNIAEKISIINDIAFQTNILSLNASVEAARAGGHGRGFAVVATEVRKLAEHSRKASDDINILSNSGVTTTESVGKQFGEAIPEIENTSRMIQEISAATNEQTSEIEQINGLIQSLNQIIQRNVSVSEEIAASANNLADQAEEMKKMVSFFNAKH